MTRRADTLGTPRRKHNPKKENIELPIPRWPWNICFDSTTSFTFKECWSRLTARRKELWTEIWKGERKDRSSLRIILLIVMMRICEPYKISQASCSLFCSRYDSQERAPLSKVKHILIGAFVPVPLLGLYPINSCFFSPSSFPLSNSSSSGTLLLALAHAQFSPWLNPSSASLHLPGKSDSSSPISTSLLPGEWSPHFPLPYS